MSLQQFARQLQYFIEICAQGIIIKAKPDSIKMEIGSIEIDGCDNDISIDMDQITMILRVCGEEETCIYMKPLGLM